MANNRMWLVNRRTGAKILLAKYYPSTGWYVFHPDLKEKMDAEFNKADFNEETWPNADSAETKKFSSGGMNGDTDWYIDYDSRGDA